MKVGSRLMVAGVAAIAVVRLMSVAIAAQGGPQQGSSPAPLLAEQAFKNVQALKGISASDFLDTMGLMTAALGFDCSECHNDAGTEKVDWAHDTPRKITSRRMVQMVQKINQENFGGRQVVTCWTCHRNRDKPLVTPRIDFIYTAPPVESDDVLLASVPGLPKADTIIDKYLNAIGGQQKLSTLTSISATGVSVGFGGFGGGAQVEFYAKAPDKRSWVSTFKAETNRDASVRSYNGKEGWVKTPLTVLGEYQVTGNNLDGTRLDAMLTFPGQIKQVLTNLRTLEPTSIEDMDCDVVQASGPGRITVTLFFEKKTGYLVRTIRYAPSPIGRMPTQTDFSDYRDVGNGIKLPTKFTFAWLDGRDAFTLSDIKVNQPIDDAKFGKPVALANEKPR